MSKTRKLTPEARKLMLADLARVHEHGERREYEEAKKLALKVAGGLAFAGIASAHVSWLLAITSDYMGQVEEAFRHISEAMRMDPMEPNVEKSFGIITDRIRRMLITPTATSRTSPRRACTGCSSKPARPTNSFTWRWLGTSRRSARATTR